MNTGMNANKAAYWVAVGALALGLSSEYQHGRFVTLHRIAEHADLVLGRISMHAEQALAAARLLTTRGGSALDGSVLDGVMASTDAAEMARDQREMLREQAEEKIGLLRDRVREGVGNGIREQIRVQADVRRAEAEIRRAEIEQMRSETRSQARLARTVNRRVVLICPKTGGQVVVNTGLHSVNVSADEGEN
jgi:hypothetical protein